MNAEILSVGTEILLGDIVNTNAQYIARQLASVGIGVYYQTSVGDNKERMTIALKNAFERADIVITTGGLGPTDDDITKLIGAEFFNKEMVLDEESYQYIEDYFKKQNFKMTESNKKQAYMPKGAKALKNNNGTAPGCMLEEDGKILIMLPGPPREVEPMFEESVLPFLKKREHKIFKSKVVKIVGVGESAAEEMVKDLIDHQTNPTIAPYAKQNEVTLRITAASESEQEADALIKPVANELYKRFGIHIFGEDNETLESAVAKLLLEKNLTISTAESITGGMLSAKLVDVPGISKIFREGFVCYSDESKINRLGVKKETIERFGAVSSEAAMEMAECAAKVAGTDIGIATTGIAGPTGQTKDKPIGLVYFGFFMNGESKARKVNYLGTRERIRTRSVVYALDFIRRELLK